MPQLYRDPTFEKVSALEVRERGLAMSDIEVAIEVKTRTQKALLVTDGQVECWIPRSQISDYVGDEDSPETIFISEWLANEKGLI